MLKSAHLLVMSLILGATGCAGMQKGLGVITYDKGSQPIMAKATADGEYSLYAVNAMDPKVSYFLHEGDPLGFKTGQTGQVIAVGGKDEVPVPDGNYVWKRR